MRGQSAEIQQTENTGGRKRRKATFPGNFMLPNSISGGNKIQLANHGNFRLTAELGKHFRLPAGDFEAFLHRELSYAPRITNSPGISRILLDEDTPFHLQAPLVLPFTANRRLLEAIIADDTLYAPLTERRRSAFARFERGNRALTLPYRRPMWVAGERTMRTMPITHNAESPELTNDGRPTGDLATLASANSGGLVHFGSVAVRHAGATALPPGVIVAPLSTALTTHAQALEPFFSRRIDRSRVRDEYLTAAFINCGAFISIAKGVRLQEPLQLLWMYPAGQTHTVFPFVVISVGSNAEVTILERHHGEGDAFICGMVDAHVAENATLNYVVLQQVSDGSQIRMHRSGVTEADAKLHWHVADLGAAKVRNATTLRLLGARSHGLASALSFRSGKQCIDQKLHIDVWGSAVRARTVTNIALNDAAVARHREHLMLRAPALHAHTDSICEGLLLARKAAIEFLPERNAVCGDIAVRQRALVGSIDAEAMFYLASRGISHNVAVKMIALGFFEPSILAFPGETLREEIRTALDERIEEASM